MKVLAVAAVTVALMACLHGADAESAAVVAGPKAPEPLDPDAGATASPDAADAPTDADAAAPKPGGPTTADYLAKLKACNKVLSTSPYRNKPSSPANVSMCGTTGGVNFVSDMDIDCDGKTTAVCSRATDPSYLPSTAGHDSKGASLDASVVLYVVVPGESTRFAYSSAGISMGSVAAVFYAGKMVFAVVGDVGPTTTVGEASYATAKELGIDPNPTSGGVSSGVTYLVLTGPKGKVSHLEDRAEVLRVGQAALATWYAAN